MGDEEPDSMLIDQVWLLKDADRLAVSRFVVDQYCPGQSRFDSSDLESYASLLDVGYVDKLFLISDFIESV